MKRELWKKFCVAAVGILVSVPGYSAPLTSFPIDLSAYWNVDGFYASETDTPAASPLALDTGGARVRAWTLPASFVDGQPNLTDDGQVAFLFGPVKQEDSVDSWRPDGSTLDVTNGKYDILYLAAMSGNGEFPGNDNQWKGQDGMVFEYADGTKKEVPIGIVNDWFWTPPEWLAPASGNPSEVLVDFVAHDSDPTEFDYLWGWSAADIGSQSHDYGKYRYANGEDFLVYKLPYKVGAKLYMKMWGNIKIEISTADPLNDGVQTQELYNSVTAFGKVFPGGGDGYIPTEQDKKIFDFDLSTFLKSTDKEFFLKFTDAAPGQATAVTDTGNWGARINQLGLFTGPVKKSSLGARLWPNLVRTDGNKPAGGLQLIRKGYRLDNTKELNKITFPNFDPPTQSPLLTIFAATLAVGEEGATSVSNFMLY